MPEEQPRHYNARMHTHEDGVPEEQPGCSGHSGHSGARAHASCIYDDDAPPEHPRHSNPLVQSRHVADAPEEVPKLSRGTRFDPCTGAPTQPQPALDPCAGGPIQSLPPIQPKFDPNTSAPIQSLPPAQPKFDPNTGAPTQVQPALDPRTGKPTGSSTAANSHDIEKLEMKAQTPMILGIIGLFVLGITLGPFAIKRGLDVKNAIKQHPEQLKDEVKCQANAGFILGVVDIVAWIVVIILVAAFASQGGCYCCCP